MKQMRLSLLLVVLIMILLGCAPAEQSTDGTVPTQVTGGNIEQEESDMDFPQESDVIEESIAQEPSSPGSEDITIDETVIYEMNDIKITATGLNLNSLFGPEVKVLIENNRSDNITVQTRNVSINDIMVETLFSADVAAGKKANDAITFMSTELNKADIELIKDVEFILHIFDSDSWEPIHDSEPIMIQTSADPDYVQEINDNGFEAVNVNGLRIIVQKLADTESFWGAEVSVLIENQSDQDVTVQVRDVSINGFMVDPMFSSDVPVGKHSYDEITFLENQLADNNISDIEDIELYFHIFDMNTWVGILDTDIIKIDFR